MENNKKEASDKEVKQYNRIKLILSLISSILAILFLLVLLLTGWSARLGEWAGEVSNSVLAFLIFAGIVGLLETLLSLPLSFYGGFIIEHRFQLSKQTF